MRRGRKPLHGPRMANGSTPGLVLGVEALQIEDECLIGRLR
jgi:hypothetical protein